MSGKVPPPTGPNPPPENIDLPAPSAPVAFSAVQDLALAEKSGISALSDAVVSFLHGGAHTETGLSAVLSAVERVEAEVSLQESVWKRRQKDRDGAEARAGNIERSLAEGEGVKKAAEKLQEAKEERKTSEHYNMLAKHASLKLPRPVSAKRIESAENALKDLAKSTETLKMTAQERQKKCVYLFQSAEETAAQWRQEDTRRGPPGRPQHQHAGRPSSSAATAGSVPSLKVIAAAPSAAAAPALGGTAMSPPVLMGGGESIAVPGSSDGECEEIQASDDEVPHGGVGAGGGNLKRKRGPEGEGEGEGGVGGH
uniref:Uncharacterized protein n=1 Tax=Chromera velia CCMP2878 TaxID=1169474 RepID=A0A0G4GT17_9ALVE|eukprot:Cvel_5176.t1-p1 / transcript=Cvel_5176.t1 / gene=Cvel_5176 / organism=Chromera_velia_CCMP2878 / gene_product=hypothetical protein / transcript_product=hypothetical protein / location=Cvel_scaffold237:87787-91077(+) / protein_length=311 / sequence_SO=supercontig / SO=protein_coding / is_pseudo=false